MHERKSDMHSLKRGPAAKNSKDNSQNQTHDEQNPGDFGRNNGNAAQPKHPCNQCNNQKCQCPANHVLALMSVISKAGGHPAVVR